MAKVAGLRMMHETVREHRSHPPGPTLGERWSARRAERGVLRELRRIERRAIRAYAPLDHTDPSAQSRTRRRRVSGLFRLVP